MRLARYHVPPLSDGGEAAPALRRAFDELGAAWLQAIELRTRSAGATDSLETHLDRLPREATAILDGAVARAEAAVTAERARAARLRASDAATAALRIESAAELVARSTRLIRRWTANDFPKPSNRVRR